MPTGVVKKWFEEKGFGFLTPEGRGQDVFVHRRALVGTYALEEGAQVAFEAEFDAEKNKWKAVTCAMTAGPDGGAAAAILPPQGKGDASKGGKGGKSGGKGGAGCGGKGKGGGKGGPGGGGGGQDGLFALGGGQGGMGGGMGGMGGGMMGGRDDDMGGPQMGMANSGGGIGGQGQQGQVDAMDRDAFMLCQGLLEQAEPLQSLAGGWILCQSPRGSFFFNRQRLQISMEPPPEIVKQQAQPQQPRPPQPPVQQDVPAMQAAGMLQQAPQQQMQPQPDMQQAGAKSTIRAQIGDWAICMDQQGEFYYHFPTSQSYDRPPPELVQLYQEQKEQQMAQQQAQNALEQQRLHQQVTYQPQQQSMPYIPDAPGGGPAVGGYGGYPGAGDLGSDMPLIRQY